MRIPIRLKCSRASRDKYWRERGAEAVLRSGRRTASKSLEPFEISSIHRASSLRQSAAQSFAPLPLLRVSHLLVYISPTIASLPTSSDIEDKKERCPDDDDDDGATPPVLGNDPYCQLLLAYAPIPAGRRESYEAPFGRSRDDSRISSSSSRILFQFSRLTSNSRRSETHVKLPLRVIVI